MKKLLSTLLFCLTAFFATEEASADPVTITVSKQVGAFVDISYNITTFQQSISYETSTSLHVSPTLVMTTPPSTMSVAMTMYSTIYITTTATYTKPVYNLVTLVQTITYTTYQYTWIYTPITITSGMSLTLEVHGQVHLLGDNNTGDRQFHIYDVDRRDADEALLKHILTHITPIFDNEHYINTAHVLFHILYPKWFKEDGGGYINHNNGVIVSPIPPFRYEWYNPQPGDLFYTDLLQIWDGSQWRP